jgi:kynurenine formamidase
MLDLTAPIVRYGHTPDITHIDLYYTGRQAPASSLVTDCVLLDLTEKVESVGLDELEDLDAVRAGNSVVLKTGWEVYRGTPRYAESPWIDRNLISTLVEKGVALVLVDSPGVYGGKAGPEHNEMDRYLADHHAYAVENLVNLRTLNTRTFRLYCFPIYMSAQNNAPCRVVAELVG